jgi:hypothetical protein
MPAQLSLITAPGKRYLKTQKRSVGPFLAARKYGIHRRCSAVLAASPAQLVFGRDMLLPVQFKADWALIHENKQRQIAKDNGRENRNRIKHQYRRGDEKFCQQFPMSAQAPLIT